MFTLTEKGFIVNSVAINEAQLPQKFDVKAVNLWDQLEYELNLHGNFIAWNHFEMTELWNEISPSDSKHNCLIRYKNTKWQYIAPDKILKSYAETMSQSKTRNQVYI